MGATHPCVGKIIVSEANTLLKSFKIIPKIFTTNMHQENPHWFSLKSGFTTTQGDLPHLHQSEKYQFVTFRLADSLSSSILEELKQTDTKFKDDHPKPWNKETTIKYQKLIGPRREYYLQQGLGSCILKNSECRKILYDAILFFDNEKYKIIAFVIMPNHVHLIILPFEDYKVEELVGRIKQFSTNRINKLFGLKGSLWQRENWDRGIRSAEHYSHCLQYIYSNPQGLKESEYTLYISET